MSPHDRLGWPNRISIARILLVPPFVVCLLNLDSPNWPYVRHIALGIFLLMALSDGLDGYLARRLNAETALGRILDPLGDKLLITVSVVILAVVGVPEESGGDSNLRLPNWVVVAALSKDLVVLIGFAVVYLATGQAFIRVRPIGKWCTTVQLALVMAMLLRPDLPTTVASLPVFLWWVATLLAAAAALDYVRIGYRFVAAAPMQPQEKPS